MVPLQQQVIERLAAEPLWRETLLADPRAAVSDLLGTALPESMAFTVHENSLAAVHLVIPPTLEQLDELDLVTLDLVGGGGDAEALLAIRIILGIVSAGMSEALFAVYAAANPLPAAPTAS